MRKIPIFIGLLAMICSIGCKSHKEEKPEEVTYHVTNPIVKDTTIVKEYVCQIHSIRHIELRAMEKGYLQSISVDEVLIGYPSSIQSRYGMVALS